MERGRRTLADAGQLSDIDYKSRIVSNRLKYTEKMAKKYRERTLRTPRASTSGEDAEGRDQSRRRLPVAHLAAPRAAPRTWLGMEEAQESGWVPMTAQSGVLERTPIQLEGDRLAVEAIVAAPRCRPEARCAQEEKLVRLESVVKSPVAGTPSRAVNTRAQELRNDSTADDVDEAVVHTPVPPPRRAKETQKVDPKITMTKTDLRCPSVRYPIGEPL